MSFWYQTQRQIDQIARQNASLNADYEIIPMPVAPGQTKSSTWPGGLAYVIPRGSKQPDAAWHLNKFLGSDEGELIWTRTQLSLPVRISVVQSPYWQERSKDPRMKVFIDLFAAALPLLAMPGAQVYWDELNAAQERVRKGEQLPKQALDDVTQRVNQEFAKYA